MRWKEPIENQLLAPVLGVAKQNGWVFSSSGRKRALHTADSGAQGNSRACVVVLRDDHPPRSRDFSSCAVPCIARHGPIVGNPERPGIKPFYKRRRECIYVLGWRLLLVTLSPEEFTLLVLAHLLATLLDDAAQVLFSSVQVHATPIESDTAPERAKV